MTKGYGIAIKDIDDSCPSELRPYEKAHKKEMVEKDTLNYQQGIYNMSAFSTVLLNIIEKHSKAEYIGKPLLVKMLEEADKEINGNPERKEEAAVYEMKQRILLLRSQGLPESPR